MTAFAVLFGCGGVKTIPYIPPKSPVTPVSSLSFAYVESSFTGTVSMFRVSHEGLWSATSPVTVPTGLVPESLAVDPSGRFVYVPNAHSDSISQYVIDLSSGVLLPNTPQTVATGVTPQWIAIEPSGRFVYTANSGDDTISMFTVDQTTGALTATKPAAVSVDFVPSVFGITDPVGVVVDPLGRFVYSSNGNGSFSCFAINASTGVLSPACPAGVRFGSFNFPPAIDPKGRFLYAPVEDKDVLLMFAINPSSGQLTPASTVMLPTGSGPTSVAIDPFGRFLYVVNRRNGTISQLQLNSDGSPVPMSTPLLSDPGQPWQILVDPSGQLAYVSNEQTATVDIYQIDPSGKLLHYGSAQAGSGAGGMGIARRR